MAQVSGTPSRASALHFVWGGCRRQERRQFRDSLGAAWSAPRGVGAAVKFSRRSSDQDVLDDDDARRAPVAGWRSPLAAGVAFIIGVVLFVPGPCGSGRAAARHGGVGE